MYNCTFDFDIKLTSVESLMNLNKNMIWSIEGEIVKEELATALKKTAEILLSELTIKLKI